MRTMHEFLLDESGFEGAEKALLICIALAIVVLVAGKIKDGSSVAAEKAYNALSTVNVAP